QILNEPLKKCAIGRIASLRAQGIRFAQGAGPPRSPLAYLADMSRLFLVREELRGASRCIPLSRFSEVPQVEVGGGFRPAGWVGVRRRPGLRCGVSVPPAP